MKVLRIYFAFGLAFLFGIIGYKSGLEKLKKFID